MHSTDVKLGTLEELNLITYALAYENAAGMLLDDVLLILQDVKDVFRTRGT